MIDALDERKLHIRRGRAGDDSELLRMFDEAVAWLVARGGAGQWGDEPWSASEKGRRAARLLVEGGGLYLLEHEGAAVGALDVGVPFEYVNPVDVPELYIRLLLTSRAHAGRAHGTRLVDRAVELARARDARLLRVDCWAGAPRLVSWYEAHGFTRSHTFVADDWHGQVLQRAL